MIFTVIDAKTNQPKNVEIIYAYEFDRGYGGSEQHSNSSTVDKTAFCFVVKDPTREELIEYYWVNSKPHLIWWHNFFYTGGKMPKLLKNTPPGFEFKYQKANYYWRVLTIEEVITFCNLGAFKEYV